MTSSADPILALAGIRKRFGAVVVADGIDLAVRHGEALGILGPNGAGKTTLFGMVTGNVRPDAGTVTFESRDVTALSPARRCRLGMARSFQVPQPFSGLTVFENLVTAAAFGAGEHESATYDRCAEILERCGLLPLANSRAGTLRLLDRKRLELARALATKPRLLLLDEVAGGLTERECETLVTLIRDLRNTGMTVVWIEHVLHALTAVADRVVVLHGGRLIAEGTATEVVRHPAVAEVYMGIPMDA
ncbi:ABC transporter ATP-binding protein [Roseomonas populi]|uniref:ABC transporter ATP-binding protein n=1 Tax=Roseomonas populi TaxID=3121582 RepID=A0ABT1X5H0_9PROT|nr:ABC transporter ATP-binding protein [Roseomonas pecuniae]MCR0983350.1 ABC transporter ATP-binding protein [Roseomonas pecuniae]